MDADITVLEGLATVALAPVLAWICLTDIRAYRIPDAATLALFVIGLFATALLDVTTPADAMIGAATGYAIFAIIGAGYFRLTAREGLGMGDAKLLGVIGVWLGWQSLPIVVALAALAALGFATVTRQRRIAFGPWLAFSFWGVWIVRISS